MRERSKEREMMAIEMHSWCNRIACRVLIVRRWWLRDDELLTIGWWLDDWWESKLRERESEVMSRRWCLERGILDDNGHETDDLSVREKVRLSHWAPCYTFIVYNIISLLFDYYAEWDMTCSLYDGHVEGEREWDEENRVRKRSIERNQWP